MKYAKGKLGVLAAMVLFAHPAVAANGRSLTDTIRRSVVKIYVTFQREDYSLPWQGGRPRSGTGTGFVIDGKRILTNAHIVSDARFLEIQKDGSPRRYRAEIVFIGHDCDLAVLEPEDTAFFKDTRPVRFADALPALNDEVTVFGYPLGGTRLSVTRGVVSRIDYSTYSHSAVDQHLVLQVDAAINPGNSGGPIVYHGRVVGLAFQGLSWAENIGYAIPLPVLQHFLTDIEDGEYDGYPELGVAFMPARNDALRRSLALPETATGVVVYYLDPFGSALQHLAAGDVLLAIDGHDIANDGTVELDDTHVLFAELLERKQWGASVELKVWRDGGEQTVDVPLTNPPDPFVFRNLYGQRPRYYIVGGLVFTPLNREVLETIARGRPGQHTHQLFYYSDYAKIDGHYRDREEFVVLLRRLPHPVNTYADKFLYGVVKRINGRDVSTLQDLPAAFASPGDGFHVVHFEGMDDTLVMDVDAVRSADPAIFQSYSIPQRSYLGGTP